MLIAQTTQVAEAVRWSPEFITALVAGLVTLVGAVAAALVAVINAARAGEKADAAQNTATLAATHAQRVDSDVTRLAEKMPADNPPAIPREHQL